MHNPHAKFDPDKLKNPDFIADIDQLFTIFGLTGITLNQIKTIAMKEKHLDFIDGIMKLCYFSTSDKRTVLV